MKKTKIYFVLLILTTAFLFNSCKKDEPKTLSCDELLTNATSAAITFGLSTTEANCISYKNALDALVKNCAYLTPAEKAEYQENRDDLDCTEYQ